MLIQHSRGFMVLCSELALPCRGGMRRKLPLLSLPLQDCDRLQGTPLTNGWPASLPGQWPIIPCIPMPSWRFFNGLQTSGEPTPSQCYDSLLAIHHSLQFFAFFFLKPPCTLLCHVQYNLFQPRGPEGLTTAEQKGKRQRREGGNDASRPSVRCGQKKSRGERLGDGRIDRWKGKKRKNWSQKWHLLKAIHLSAMRDDAIIVMHPTAAVLNWWVATQKWVAGLFWQALGSMGDKKNYTKCKC